MSSRELRKAVLDVAVKLEKIAEREANELEILTEVGFRRLAELATVRPAEKTALVARLRDAAALPAEQESLYELVNERWSDPECQCSCSDESCWRCRAGRLI